MAPALRRLSALPLLALPLALLLCLSPAARHVANLLDDALLRGTAQPREQSQLLLVDLDDAALNALQPRLGPWPYSRDIHALLIDYLREAGAKLIVLDIVFEAERPGDARLASTLAAKPDVVLAAAALRQAQTLDAPSPQLPRQVHAATPLQINNWPAALLPAAPLLQANAGAGALGLISMPLDADGRLRRLPLLQQVQGRLISSLPLAALERAQGQDWQLEGNGLRVGRLLLPIDAQASVRLQLPSNAAALPRLNAATLLGAALGEQDDAALRPLLAGRSIFIGSSAFFADQVMTPQGQHAGTELLALSYGELAAQNTVRDASTSVAALLLLVASIPVWLGWRQQRPRVGHLAATSIATAALLITAGWLALTQARVMLPLLPPLLNLACGLLLGALAQLRWQTLTERRLELERAVAEAANEAKSQFLANVSHEIRTPMNALLGLSELLAKTELTPEQRRYVSLFRSSGQNLFELINDLLDISKIEAGHMRLSCGPLRLRPLVEDQLELLHERATSAGLYLRLELAADAHERAEAWLLGDSKRIAQVLVNLVGNAIKFTREGGVTVRIACGDKQHGEEMILSVHDTGIGIAASKHELIFQPFTQADGTVTRLFGGTGLGLAISRTLVQMMGGRLWLESQPGQGSSFHLALPLPPAEAPALAPPAALPAQALTPLNILLCEDNEVNVLVIEAMLKSQGHQLDVAGSGEQGLVRLQARRYDLVLMDVQMPGMDGHSATRRLRELEQAHGWPRTPVIALTAHAFEADALRSQAAGCDDHLSKPISQATLLQALARHGRHQPAGEPVLSAGAQALDALLDPSQARLAPGSPERQRRLAHARVFLGGWRRSWAAADEAQRLALRSDLLTLAQDLGATALARAAAGLGAGVGSDSNAEALERERAALLTALGEAAEHARPH